MDITANHQGYFIFKLCANNDIFQDPQQNCFDANPLWVGGGDPRYNQTRYPIHDYETGLRMVYVRLPLEITCDQCILQWSYVAGEIFKGRTRKLMQCYPCRLHTFKFWRFFHWTHTRG